MNGMVATYTTENCSAILCWAIFWGGYHAMWYIILPYMCPSSQRGANISSLDSPKSFKINRNDQQITKATGVFCLTRISFYWSSKSLVSCEAHRTYHIDPPEKHWTTYLLWAAVGHPTTPHQRENRKSHRIELFSRESSQGLYKSHRIKGSIESPIRLKHTNRFLVNFLRDLPLIAFFMITLTNNWVLYICLHNPLFTITKGLPTLPKYEAGKPKFQSSATPHDVTNPPGFSRNSPTIPTLPSSNCRMAHSMPTEM